MTFCVFTFQGKYLQTKSHNFSKENIYKQKVTIFLDLKFRYLSLLQTPTNIPSPTAGWLLHAREVENLSKSPASDIALSEDQILSVFPNFR